MSLLYLKNKKIKAKGVTSAKEFVSRAARNITLPPRAILCPLPTLTKRVENHIPHTKYRCLADIYAFKKQPICYVTNFGSGGPAIAALTEVLAELGVKELVFMGLAGSIQEEVKAADIVLCQESICADGTSPHYISQEIAAASPTLLSMLSTRLWAINQAHHIGRNWTTDALFRETRQEIRHYQKQHALTVEMETSALYAVCKKRKLKGLSALVISDELAQLTWNPFFGDKRIFQALEILFQEACKL